MRLIFLISREKKLQKTQPIGIFDSGVGGTSIWKELHTLLPFEDTLYLADSKNAPYGDKTQDEIIALSIKNTEFLLQKNCKIIIVACNTATTNAIKVLREKYSVPFIGIEPAIKPAALQTKTKTIGILATKGTLSSALFHTTMENFTEGINVIEVEGKGLVSLIENGALESAKMETLLKRILKPFQKQQIDTLVLGCTHYPYLIPQIKKILSNNIKIIDSGEAVALQTKKILEAQDLLQNQERKSKLIFYSNDSINILQFLLQEYKQEIVIQHKEF